MKRWFCYREPTTGRWLADGQRWCNLPEHALRFQQLEWLYREWLVMEELPYVFTDPPSIPQPIDKCYERITAKAWRFCITQIPERRPLRNMRNL